MWKWWTPSFKRNVNPWESTKPVALQSTTQCGMPSSSAPPRSTARSPENWTANSALPATLPPPPPARSDAIVVEIRDLNLGPKARDSPWSDLAIEIEIPGVHLLACGAARLGLPHRLPHQGLVARRGRGARPSTGTGRFECGHSRGKRTALLSSS